MKIIDYIEEYGEVIYPEGFEAQLKGKTIEEQMKCFSTAGSSNFRHTGWSDRTSTRYSALEDNEEVLAIVVKDGLIAGIIANDDDGYECFIAPEKGICTYYAEDNNGAGYKTRTDYLYLVCVPENK